MLLFIVDEMNNLDFLVVVVFGKMNIVKKIMIKYFIVGVLMFEVYIFLWNKIILKFILNFRLCEICGIFRK